MIRTIYAVATPIPWEQMTIEGKKLNTDSVGFGFLPLFRCERIAKKCFPGHIIIPMEYEDDPEIQERPNEERPHSAVDSTASLPDDNDDEGEASGDNLHQKGDQ